MSSHRVLLTGSEGYVGRVIRDRMPADRFDVTGVDLAGDPDRKCDLCDAGALSALDDLEVDVVIHAAVDQTSAHIYDNNVASTRNLFSWVAQQKAVKGVIFMSGALVTTPADIQYTRSKLFGENTIVDIGVPWIVVRPDAIYGPGETKIVEYKNMIKKGFIPVIGDGKYLRSPTHVWDLVDFMMEVIDTGRFTNKVYEFGSPVPINQKTQLKTLGTAMGAKCRAVHIPNAIAHLLFKVKGGLDLEQIATLHYDRVVDLTRLHRDFKVRPRSFDEGVNTLVGDGHA